MKIYLLPGINPNTEAWARKLLQELAEEGDSTTVQHYLHWDEGTNSPPRIAEEIEHFKRADIDLLIGKSLGVRLGLPACSENVISPKRAVFIGTPIQAFVERNLDLGRLTAALPMPALFIQQKDDIVGSAAALREHIGDQANLIEVPGNNHAYKDLKLLTRHIRRWLAD